MNNKEDEQNDSETILLALDQISQTIDVMNSVVGRLRHYVEEQELNVQKQELTEEAEIREAMRPGRILH